jgi:hypothetical protein
MRATIRWHVLAIMLALFVCADGRSPWAQGRNEGRWVGTWATALVARPQAPQGQTPPAQPPPPNAGPASQTQAGPTAPPQPPQGRGGPGALPPLNFSNQTLRQIVHTSVGGDRIRVIFSNVFGTAPLAIGAASVALREKEAAIIPKSDRMLAFGGSPSTVVPAGAVVFSDPVNLNVSPQADVAIVSTCPGIPRLVRHPSQHT